MLETGMKAPVFTLQEKERNSASISDFLGNKVVLYFYPKDNTPGCTRQACAFSDVYEGFKDKNVVVIGISKDSVASHKRFAERFNVTYILLSDTLLFATDTYGAWQKMGGKVSMGVVRTAFIIGENCVIEKIMPQGQAGHQCCRNT